MLVQLDTEHELLLLDGGGIKIFRERPGCPRQTVALAAEGTRRLLQALQTFPRDPLDPATARANGQVTAPGQRQCVGTGIIVHCYDDAQHALLETPAGLVVVDMANCVTTSDSPFAADEEEETLARQDLLVNIGDAVTYGCGGLANPPVPHHGPAHWQILGLC